MAATSAVAVETVLFYTPQWTVQPIGYSIKKLLVKIGLEAEKSSAEFLSAFTTTITMLGYVKHARTFSNVTSKGCLHGRSNICGQIQH